MAAGALVGVGVGWADRDAGGDQHRLLAGLRLFLGGGGAHLAALRDEGDRVVLLVRGVDEGAEAAQPFGVLERLGPLVLVGVHVLGHGRLKVRGDAERVVHHHVLDVLQAAVELLLPARGALQPVGGADVVHEVAVDVPDQGLLVQVLGEELGVRRLEAAVAADVEVPALVRGDHADVLAAGLGAFAGAAGDAHLQFVRAAQAAVAQLQRDREGDGVLHPEAAPGGADAGLHGAQALAVGLAGLEAGVHQFLPDVRELLQPGAEHVDPLAAGDLGVEAVLLGDGGDHAELLRGDLAAGDPRDHRVAAVLLHVGEGAVVGVLQGAAAGVEHVGAVLAGEDVGDGGLADVAAGAGAVAGQDVLEGGQFQDPDGVEEFLRGRVRSARRGPWRRRRRTWSSSPSSSFFSIGTQEPHWVPARVQPLSSPSSWTGALPSQAPQPLTASRMAPAATLLQEHRMASSGSSVSGASPPPAAVR